MRFSPTATLLVSLANVFNLSLGLDQCTVNQVKLDLKAAHLVVKKKQVLLNDVMVNYLKCLGSSAETAAECIEKVGGVSEHDLTFEGGPNTNAIFACASPPDIQTKATICANQMALDAKTEQESALGLVTESKKQVCEDMKLPICTFTYKFPSAENIEKGCLADPCTEKDIIDQYKSMAHADTINCKDADKCTLDIDCPGGWTWVLWVLGGLLVIGAAVVGFIMWRKKSNA